MLDKSQKSILIANRGEPVRRAAATFRRLGFRIVTIAVTDDLRAPWVAESDQVMWVPSYIDADAVLQAALQSGACAVWPGWGFLSENEIFAKKIEEAGLIWIGPSARAITLMGSKSEATAQAKAAGFLTIPEFVIPGDQPAHATLPQVVAACRQIGFPALLKPALGGGGQGQEIIKSESELKLAWESVCTINARQFRSGPILVQKYFSAARHVEAQVLCDRHGHVVVLGERDCSVQRRNQKVIEEAPCPVFTPELRAHFISECTRLVKHIGYDNVGTVECLFEAGKIYFLEMNTRLQVEHTVTEEVARVKGERIDLVEWMWRVANGEALPFLQDDVRLIGHAIEARVYAEDPKRDFSPAPGTAHFVKFPRRAGTRIESAMGDFSGTIHPSFDPMIAKIIAHGEGRAQAICNLDSALRDTVILGVPTNLSFCREILAQAEFARGDYDTRFLQKHTGLRGETPQRVGLALAVAAATRYAEDLKQVRWRLRSDEPTSLFHVLRQVPLGGAVFDVEYWGKTVTVTVQGLPDDTFRVMMAGLTFQFRLRTAGPMAWTVVFEQGRILPVWAYLDASDVQMSLAGDWYRLRLQREGEKGELRDAHAAPMAGQVVTVFAKVGDTVVSGQDLFQIESMKMVTTIRAARPGRVQSVRKKNGDVVKSGELVVEIPQDVVASVNHGAQWRTTDLGEADPGLAQAPVDRLRAFFRGFDVTLPEANAALQMIFEKSEKPQAQFDFVAEILREEMARRELVTVHAHAFAFLVERGLEADALLPTEVLKTIEELLPAYGLRKTADFENTPAALIRLLQACGQSRVEKEDLLVQVLCAAAAQNSQHPDLARLIEKWLGTKPLLTEARRDQILLWLSKLDVKTFQKIAALPVSADYWDEYRRFDQNPGETLSSLEFQSLMQKALDATAQVQANYDYAALPERFRAYFQKWFAAFVVRVIDLPPSLTRHNLSLFELKHTQPDVPSRFVVTAVVRDLNMVVTPNGEPSLPAFERASIESYRLLRLLQGVCPHQSNHVFLLTDSEAGIPWKTRDDESKARALSPELARQIAARVSGFASDVKVLATEALLPLHKIDTGKLYWTIIEVRHVKPYGVISRPPFLLSERQVENPTDRLREMNENQHRMGKLINKDRAMLLFDEGEYEELQFPEVDDVPDVGLNVYQGLVGGVPTLAYASDFRLRGGALGEREGKKLAASVVLAYLTNRVLVGFHDGAGANIKESVASLGWAGAYFGAIANTGGFSNPQKFHNWLSGHLDRAYFEKVLHHFGHTDDLDEQVAQVSRQLLHFHLHVGATVGMLVYGASIANMSLMNDQPESYRVLTGSAAVQRVTGEDATNYQLGGAKAHAEESGDIEMAFESEEKVIYQTRHLIRFLRTSARLPQIARDTALPPVEIPKEAGILLTREAIRAQLDAGEFFETRATLKQATGLLSGYGALAGQPVALLATTTDYGNFHAKGFKKAAHLALAAHDLHLPLVLACGAQWEAPSKPVAADWLLARREFLRALSELPQPKISLALGARSIERLVHESFDLTIAVKRGQESEFEKERLAKWAPFVSDSLTQAYDLVAKILPFVLDRDPVWCSVQDVAIDPADRACTFVLPDRLNEVYDMRAVVADVFDRGSFLELWSGDQLPLRAGFARLGGRAVGVIADDPQVEAGAQNVGAVAKFTRFNRLCARFGLPIIELSDSPAFRPGSEQEHGGIQGEGGKSIREECLSDIPKIVVTLRQNYGGRLIHANLVTLGPKRAGLILEGAKIGVMGAKGAAVVLARKKLAALPELERAAAEAEWIADYEEKQLSPAKAVELGYVKAPILLVDLRKKLFSVLRVLSK